MEHDQSDTSVSRWQGSYGVVALGVASCDAHGRSYDMTTTAPTQTIRLAGAGIVGLAVGAVCVWRTGLFSAFPSALGLTMLASSDYGTRRIPRDVFAATAAATVGLGVLDAAHAAVRANGERLLAASLRGIEMQEAQTAQSPSSQKTGSRVHPSTAPRLQPGSVERTNGSHEVGRPRPVDLRFALADRSSSDARSHAGTSCWNDRNHYDAAGLRCVPPPHPPTRAEQRVDIGAGED